MAPVIDLKEIGKSLLPLLQTQGLGQFGQILGSMSPNSIMGGAGNFYLGGPRFSSNIDFNCGAYMNNYMANEQRSMVGGNNYGIFHPQAYQNNYVRPQGGGFWNGFLGSFIKVGAAAVLTYFGLKFLADKLGPLQVGQGNQGSDAPKTFGDWSNKASLDYSNTGDFTYYDGKDPAALQKTNDVVNGKSKDATGTSAYTESLMKAAADDMAIYGNTDSNPNSVSEEEYLQGEIKKYNDGSPDAPLAGDALKQFEDMTLSSYGLLDIDGKDGITQAEFAAEIARTDASNAEGLADGKVTKEELLNQGMFQVKVMDELATGKLSDATQTEFNDYYAKKMNLINLLTSQKVDKPADVSKTEQKVDQTYIDGITKQTEDEMKAYSNIDNDPNSLSFEEIIEKNKADKKASLGRELTDDELSEITSRTVADNMLADVDHNRSLSKYELMANYYETDRLNNDKIADGIVTPAEQEAKKNLKANDTETSYTDFMTREAEFIKTLLTPKQ